MAHPCSAFILTDVCSFPPHEYTTVYSFTLLSMHKCLGCRLCYCEQCCCEQIFMYVFCMISTCRSFLDVVDLLGHGIKEWPTIWVNASVSQLFASLMLTAVILWTRPPLTVYISLLIKWVSTYISLRLASCFLITSGVKYLLMCLLIVDDSSIKCMLISFAFFSRAIQYLWSMCDFS